MPRTSWIVAAVALALTAATAVDVTTAATVVDPPAVRITNVLDEVTVTNQATAPVDLSGWTLSGPGDQPYELTGVLPAGTSTTVPAAHALGTVVLRDPRGVTAHACRTATPVRTSMPCPTAS